MTLRVICTVLEIALFVAVLGFFLNRITQQTTSINRTLAKITFGVRAVEQQCLNIGPAADRLNGNLQGLAQRLDDVANRAERLRA